MEMIDRLVKGIEENKYYQYLLFIGAFVVLFTIMLFFYPLHAGHDLGFHILRFDALIDAIKDGVFPVYIDYTSADNYGYATKWFYSDFVLIPFAFIAQYVGTISAYKLLIASYTIICALLSYISIYKVFKNRYVAFIFCVLYTFSYYRLYDVYNRAALGETICLTFLPLVIWGAYEIIKGNYKKWYILSIAFALMIYSHINTPIIVAVVVAIFMVMNYKSFIKEPIRLLYLTLAAVVCVLLTSYFIFPLIEQMLSNGFYYALTNEKAISFNVMAGEPIKYIIRGLFSGATYVVPEIAGIGIVITITVLLRVFIQKNALVKAGDQFLIVGLISLFIISPLYPWRTFPFSLIGFIQFSWRFYSVATVILCVPGAIYFYEALKTDRRRYLVGIPFISMLTIIVLINSGQVFSNNFKEYKYSNEPKSYENGYGLMGAEYMPDRLPNVVSFFHKRGSDSIRCINNKAEIENYERKLRVLAFDVNTNEADSLELPLVYYKGYKAEWISNQRPMKMAEDVPITQSENGLIQMPIQAPITGLVNVKVYFGGTIIQNVSPYITLIMIILLTIYIIRFNRKEKRSMINKLEKLLSTERNYNGLVLMVLILMSAVMMIFYSPLCPGGDFYVHFNRLVVLMEALSGGTFPAYMDYYMIDGYGYLIKAFYCDLILVPFAVVGNLTSATVAYQVIIFTLTFLCGGFTYFAVKKIVQCKYSALLTALLYTFATYRIFDIYIRGALGEVLSFTFLPIVLLGAYEIIKGDYKKWYWLTIGFCLLIFSHVISTVLAFFTLAIFLLIYYKSFVKEPKRLFYLILSGIVCLPITAYYLLPMIEQMMSNSFYYDTHKITSGVTGFRLNEVVAGLFNSVSLRKELLFPKLGAVLTFIILLRVFVREKSPILRFVDICVIVGLVFIVMTTPLFPWTVFPFSLLDVIQFPWRLLEYTSLLFAIAGGYYLTKLLQTKKQKLVGIVGIIAIHILIFNSDSIHYRTFVCKDGKPEITVNTSFLGIIGGEYLPSRIPSNNQVYDIPNVYNDYIHQREQVIKSENGSTITHFTKDKGHIAFDVEVGNSDKLELSLTYYIGYKVTLDGEPLPYQQSEFGLIEIPVNKSGKVEVIYTGTSLQRVSYYITIISILIFITYIIVQNRRNKVDENSI